MKRTRLTAQSADLAVYQIEIQGRLEADWSDWLDGMQITYTDKGDTLITGRLPDQAALHGLLAKIRDLGVTLLAVRRVV